MRAVKRERYGEKELNRLNNMLAAAGDVQFLPEIKEEKEEENRGMIVDGEAETSTTTELTPGRSGSRRSRFEKSKGVSSEQIDLTQEDAEVEKMTVDGERIFRKKTMRDQFGQYPDWMNKRKIRTQQKKNNRLKRRAKSLKRK